jgi:acetyl-CoA C-acetyltransferase
MAVDPRCPVIVGVGQHLHRANGVDDGVEPIALIAAAVGAATADAGLVGLPGSVDSIRVVNLLSWRYGNPAWVLARRLGVEARELAQTTAGGNSPQALVNRTAGDIAAGRADIVVLAGGEAWRTRMRVKRTGTIVDWAKAPETATPLTIGDELDMTHPGEAARGIYLPVQVYPLFESAARAAAGTSPDEHVAEIAELWARFSAVAATNPNAWSPTALTPEEIATVTADNRIVGLPYRKLMNANNDVDMAAALVMCSAERATALGIARDRWVFPHAGTDCHEHPYVSNRWSLAETPAVRTGGRQALALAGVGIDDIAIVDLYSCFPSAVRLGAASLGLDLTAQLTRTGGLSFAGGPWNNYSMHAIATVVSELRDRPAERALVWANGGYLTKHSFGIYAATPPPGGFRHDRPQQLIDELPMRALADADEAAAAAVEIEAYTVMHDRGGTPELAITACRLADGRRAWATSSEPGTTMALTAGEWVGRKVDVDTRGTLHV